MSGTPSGRDAWENWNRWPGSLAEKMRLALRNNARKALRRTNCCGNHGEPGC